MGQLKDISKFDSKFFGVHHKQAHLLDPQARILLESTYESIVDAGLHKSIHVPFSSLEEVAEGEFSTEITFGGKVPEKFYIKNCRIPLSPLDPNVKCMTVRARSMKNVSCVVREANTKIRFQLKSENGSIYFSVLYREFGPNPDDIELPEEDEYLDETADNFKYKQISVELREQSHCAQEDLTNFLPWPGIYVVRLNNSSNWFTSRKIMVKLELFPPSKEAK